MNRPFQCGLSNPRWSGGKTVTERGYVRITSGPDRWKYEHRAITKRTLAENKIGPAPKIWEVHHQDFNKQHNCLENLLIISPALHSHAERFGALRAPRASDRELLLFLLSTVV